VAKEPAAAPAKGTARPPAGAKSNVLP
jgi:hypothetical protein